MDKKKKDYLTRTLGFQTVICLLLFGILFGLKQGNTELFKDIKEMFSSKLSEQIQIEDAKSVFSSFSNSKNESETTEDETEYTPLEEPSLSAEIIVKGGADVPVSNEKDIPDNVSLDDYKLNQAMVLPLKGNTTSEFGVRAHPISGDLRFHAGVDIAAETGSPIYAAFDGQVATATSDIWNGNYIKLQHDNNIMTVYCHCSKLNVSKGQKIRAGEVIGFVGSTGNSTGPHLHFELRINDISYNPTKALKDSINDI